MAGLDVHGGPSVLARVWGVSGVGALPGTVLPMGTLPWCLHQEPPEGQKKQLKEVSSSGKLRKGQMMTGVVLKGA